MIIGATLGIAVLAGLCIAGMVEFADGCFSRARAMKRQHRLDAVYREAVVEHAAGRQREPRLKACRHIGDVAGCPDCVVYRSAT